MITTAIRSFRHLLVHLLLLQLIGSLAIADDEYIPIKDWGILGEVEFEEAQSSHELVLVVISGSKLEPAEAVVQMETVVVFENRDRRSHRLVFIPDYGNYLQHEIELGELRPGERQEIEFLDAGVFPYRCLLHPDEQGLIEIR